MADRNYLALFVAESAEQLERLGSELVALEAVREKVPAELWDSIFRRVHSIKGSAATLELRGLVSVAHASEELIARLRIRPHAPAREAIDLLLEASDALSRLLKQARRALEEREAAGAATTAPLEPAEAPEPDVASLVIRLELLSGSLPASLPGPLPAKESAPAAPAPALSDSIPRYTLRIRLSPRCAAPGARAMIVQRKLKSLSAQLVLEPLPAQLAQSATPHLFLAHAASEAAPLALQRACLGLPEVEGVEILGADGAPLLEEKNRDPKAEDRAASSGAAASAGADRAASDALHGAPRAIAPTAAAPPASPAAAADVLPAAPGAAARASAELLRDASVRVRADALDQLLDAAGEVLGGVARLRESARLLPESLAPAFEAEVDRLRRLVRELHGKVVSARLTPFSTLTERLPRAVRDLSRRLGKEVELEVQGAEVELDRAVIDAMGNPLSHLVRNAIDHGLERPEERIAAGKPARGKLSLRARRERDRVLVEVADDGRGIDVAEVKRKAVESGAVSAELASGLSDAQALELAFLPGVSTRAAATEVSGRGVGLDAVLRAVEALGGSLSASSSPARGAVFTLELPRSVAMANLLLIMVGGEIFGLPIARVLVTIESDLSARGGEGFESRSVIVAGAWVRAFPLAQLFGLPSLAPPGPRPFVVLEVDGVTFALAVDRLVGQEEAVVRPLFPPLDRMRGLAGTCVLASGRPLLVLDPRGLAELAEVPGVARSAVPKSGFVNAGASAPPPAKGAA